MSVKLHKIVWYAVIAVVLSMCAGARPFAAPRSNQDPDDQESRIRHVLLIRQTRRRLPLHRSEQAAPRPFFDAHAVRAGVRGSPLVAPGQSTLRSNHSCR
jgi:hypothetical protein